MSDAHALEPGPSPTRTERWLRTRGHPANGPHTGRPRRLAPVPRPTGPASRPARLPSTKRSGTTAPRRGPTPRRLRSSSDCPIVATRNARRSSSRRRSAARVRARCRTRRDFAARPLGRRSDPGDAQGSACRADGAPDDATNEEPASSASASGAGCPIVGPLKDTLTSGTLRPCPCRYPRPGVAVCAGVGLRHRLRPCRPPPVPVPDLWCALGGRRAMRDVRSRLQ